MEIDRLKYSIGEICVSRGSRVIKTYLVACADQCAMNDIPVFRF